MGVIAELLRDVEIPGFYKVRNHMEDTHTEDAAQAVREALKREGTLERIRAGSTVCFWASSREIAGSAVILRTLAEEVKRIGAVPYIVPGMGSHGGASAEGQRAILEHYGITKEACGCEIAATMETGHVGYTPEGLEVRLDAFALSCDYIVPVGRIKPHTDFRGSFESGIMKMLAIGLGKQHGAGICHQQGMAQMHKNVPAFGRCCLENCSIPFGVGILENHYHQTYAIHAIPSEYIEEEEPRLLEKAKELQAGIPFDKADVLILEQIGKDISGCGMDTNVVGRSCSWTEKPFLQRIGVLDLSSKSGANFMGIGNADVTTRRVLEKASFEETYPNGITARTVYYMKMPPVMENDRLALAFCIQTCLSQGGPVKIVWAKDTLHLGEFYVSESMIEEVRKNPALSTDGQLYELDWDEEGNYKGFFCFC